MEGAVKFSDRPVFLMGFFYFMMYLVHNCLMLKVHFVWATPHLQTRSYLYWALCSFFASFLSWDQLEKAATFCILEFLSQSGSYWVLFFLSQCTSAKYHRKWERAWILKRALVDLGSNPFHPTKMHFSDKLFGAKIYPLFRFVTSRMNVEKYHAFIMHK